jgi:DNA topoisomerase-1
MITVRNGRFGPYVTDGEVNASLRTADSPDTIAVERAAELLQARRDRLASGDTPTKKARKRK